MDSTDAVSRRPTYRFVQASDLYLDAPVRGVPAAPMPLRAALRDGALRAWQSLVDLAVEREVAFVILAGGLFGDTTPGLRSCVALRDGLERLRARAIDVFIGLDRDDAAAAAQLPWLSTGATLFAADRMDTAAVMRGGQCLATLRGISGDGPGARQQARELRPFGRGVEIGVLPAQAKGAGADGSCSWAAELLPAGGLDYWALGGAPAAAVLRESPWIVCAGTPQGRGLESHQLGAKGCMLVDVAEGRITTVAPAALDHVRFARLEPDVGGCADAAAIRRLLRRELERSISDAGDRVAVVEATLRGRMPDGVARDRLSFEAELLADLRRDSAIRAASVWWARVRDLTTRDDRPDAAGPRHLRRIVTEQSEALGAPLPGSTFLARAFAPLLRQVDAETDLAAQRELVHDAATLALDVLRGEEGG